jgi:hypothetical protein
MLVRCILFGLFFLLNFISINMRPLYVKFYHRFYISIEDYYKNFTAKGKGNILYQFFERKRRYVITQNIFFLKRRLRGLKKIVLLSFYQFL